MGLIVWFADMVGWLDGGMDQTSKSRLLLRGIEGVRIKGALQTTQDPNVPKIIPVIILVITCHRISIENTDSIIYYCTYTAIVLCIHVLLHTWAKNLHVPYI